MSNKIHAHITLDGVPICQRGPHLLSRTITCGHRSLASAHRARRELQKQVTWDRIKVVRGDCPAYDGPIDIEPVTQSDLNLLNRDEFTVALRKAARADAKLTAGEVSLLLNEAARRLVALGDAFELEHKRAERLQRSVDEYSAAVPGKFVR